MLPMMSTSCRLFASADGARRRLAAIAGGAMLAVVGATAPGFAQGEPTNPASGMVMTFDEEFNDLSVSAGGPGTRWTAHTPNNKDFGSAAFANPEGPDNPFSVSKGVLRIRASKSNGKWKSGLLASVDPHGQGFSQRYGYFEMRAKMPSGAGTWPAFWLLSTASVTDRGAVAPEIDIVEEYGHNPTTLFAAFHLWYPDGKDHLGMPVHPTTVADMTADFHVYGLKWDEANITFYFVGRAHWTIKTPEEAQVPMFVFVDLALGGGWPIDKTPSPADMYVDYVRVYKIRDSEKGQ
jgi:beta-glucanase (GH16 family)